MPYHPPRSFVIVWISAITFWLAACPAPTARAEARAEYLQFTETSREPLPYGHPYALQLVGNRAYLANGEGGLVILDIGSSAPKQLGRFITGNIGRDAIDRESIHEYRGRATAIAVSGNFAFLLTQSKGYDISRPKILRIDISAPAKPLLAGECLLDGVVSDIVALDASHVCLLGGKHASSYPGSDTSIAIVDFSEPGREHVTATTALPRLPALPKGRANKFTPAHIAISHGLALVTGTHGDAAGHGTGTLHIFSLADPSAPSYVATCEVGATAGALSVDRTGAYAYIASGSDLHIIDLNDPLVPRVARTLPAGGEISAIAVDGNTGFLATSTSLLPMDLSDPAQPSLGPLVNIGPVAMAAAGGRLVLTDPTRGIAAAAIAQFAPDKLSWFATSGPETPPPAADQDVLLTTVLAAVEPSWRERVKLRGVLIQENLAYLATGRDGLRIMDVSDPAKPLLLGHYYDLDIGRMSVADVKVRDHKAYLADLDNGLYILDVSDPKRPTALAHYHTPNAHTVDLAGQIAVLADGVYGLSAIDVRDAANPRLVGQYHARDIRCTSATVLPGPADAPPTIRVADSGFLRTMKLVPGEPPPANEGPIELVSHVKVPMGIPDVVRVSEDGATVYLAADEGWNFTAIDARDPAHMRMRSVSATGGFCHGAALRGTHAYVTNNYEACTIFDVADPSNPKLAGSVIGLTRCTAAAVEGDALGLCTKEGIILAGLADPAHPQIAGKVPGIGSEFTLHRHEAHRYLLGTNAEGLEVWDASTLSTPQRLTGIPIKGAVSVCAQGDLAFVTRNFGGGKAQIHELLVIRLAAPQPTVIATLAMPSPLWRLAAAGRTLYVGGAQLSVIDIADPTHPRIVSHVDPARHEGTYGGETVSSIAAFTRDGQERVAIADHFWGVRIFDASDKAGLKELGEFAVSGGDFTGIQATKDRVYVSNNWGGIYFVDTKDPLHPQIVGGTRRLFSAGSATGEKANKGSSSGLVVGDRLYYQGNTDYVLRIADVHDAAHPRLLTEFPLPKQTPRNYDDRRFGAAYPQLRDKYLYTPSYARVFDISDPEKPALVGECREAGFTNGTCLLTDVAAHPYLVIASSEALKIVDIQDPAKPALAGTLPGDYEGGFYFGRGLRADGPIIYILNRHQLNTVDISDPTRPRRLASLELSGFCSDIQIADGRAFIAAYYDGLQVIDIRDPKNLRPIDHFQQGVYQDAAAWDNIGCYQSIDIAGDYAYVTEYYSGMLVLRIRHAATQNKSAAP